ncbi:MAG: hypothetical protein AAF193_11815, partial [Bacteroidota bacterium]
MRHLYLLATVVALSFTAQGQIIWTEPAFPTQDQQVTLYYDASQGNGDLDGVLPLYAHTGVITNLSSGPSDWQHVQGNWGTADANVIMTPLGNNIHQFNFGGQTLADFYGIGAGETINALAFVFRNQAGTSVGRDEDGSDIFFDLTDGSFAAVILSPDDGSIAVQPNETVEVVGQSSESASLTINVNGQEVATETGANEITYDFSESESGEYEVEFVADNGMDQIMDSFTIIVLPNQPVESIPAGIELGINYTSDASATLRLFAPNKDDIFVIGDFN